MLRQLKTHIVPITLTTTLLLGIALGYTLAKL